MKMTSDVPGRQRDDVCVACRTDLLYQRALKRRWFMGMNWRAHIATTALLGVFMTITGMVLTSPYVGKEEVVYACNPVLFPRMVPIMLTFLTLCFTSSVYFLYLAHKLNRDNTESGEAMQPPSKPFTAGLEST
jgi:hypothetical protein